MKRLLHALIALGFYAGIALSCSARAEEADALRAALRPEWVKLEAGARNLRNPGDDRFVVLLGENHASVRGQIHLAALLEQLLDGKLIDAILVEGSQGPIDIRDFDAEMAKLLPRNDLAKHWRRQLEWGQVAGWEYVALTRPQIPTLGVEDMAAKTRFFVTDLNGSDAEVQRQLTSWQRGAECLEAAVAALEHARHAKSKARSLLAGYRQRLGAYRSAAQSFAEQRKPLVSRQLEVIETGEEMERLLADTGLADLRGAKNAEDLFRQRIERLAVEQPAQVARLVELIEKSQAMEGELRGHGEKIEPFAKALVDHGEAVEDAYFTLANQLRTAAEGRWGREVGTWPPEVAKALASVDSYFRDEAKRQREEGQARARQQLAERDRAMAANTERYLREGSARRVALIVGSAHLDGMTAELGALGLPFFSGRLLPEESEPWEEAAWERRRQATEKIFETGNMKERSRLLDPIWRDEQLAQARKLVDARAAKHEVPLGQERSEISNSLLPDQRTPRGPQVLAFGPVPGSAGEIYEVWDRVLSRDFVKKLSDDRLELVFGFHRRDEQGRLAHTLVTRQGERSLEEFQKTPPGEKGKRPTYVVTFYEPDFQLLNDTAYSPLWKELRLPNLATGGGGGKIPTIPGRSTAGPEDGPGKKGGSGGGNGGGRNGGNGRDDGRKGGRRDDTGNGGGGDKKPPAWTALGPRDPERPRMIRTYNPQRAREHIDRILEQKPLEPTEVEVFDDPRGLVDARFAERDGTYAGMVVLVADNSSEFRDAVREAAAGRKFANKQVALITCGHAFPETAALREFLLSSGALMVWTPERQITPEAGERLMEQIKTTLKTKAESDRFRDIDDLTNRAIWELLQKEPGNPDYLILRESGSWVALPDLAPHQVTDTEEERHA
jgi:hypothetical protein